MEETFFLSNAVPQEGEGFNRNIWARLEALARKLAISRREIYVITGPVYQGRRPIHISDEVDACGNSLDLDLLPVKVVGENKVAVPLALYKIIYDPRLNRANAYLMPNVDHRDLQEEARDIDYLESYRVGVDTVEDLTGWQFFTAFSEREHDQLAETCAATMLR